MAKAKDNTGTAPKKNVAAKTATPKTIIAVKKPTKKIDPPETEIEQLKAKKQEPIIQVPPSEPVSKPVSIITPKPAISETPIVSPEKKQPTAQVQKNKHKVSVEQKPEPVELGPPEAIEKKTIVPEAIPEPVVVAEPEQVKEIIKVEKKEIKPENKPAPVIDATPEVTPDIKPKINKEVEMEKTEPMPLKELLQEDIDSTLLMEIAWEVCNQVGGIYTVIQSKVPATKLKWADNYILLGPYFKEQASTLFEHDKTLYTEDNSPLAANQKPDPVKEVVKAMNTMGFSVHYGTWLIDGRPKVVLFDPWAIMHRINDYKFMIWDHHKISLPGDDKLVDQVVTFGFQVYEFLRLLAENPNNDKRLLAHFHEWMAGIPIPELRRAQTNVKTVFTTHATMLGRYLAMNDTSFYDHLPFYDWQKEASHFNISHIVNIERAASHGAHIFSTVSDITANECKYLIGREPEAIFPNGLNIKRFEVLHEFQNLHKKNKLKVNEFVMGHFFHNYSFDLDKTLYFFTSGRFEHYNKGFDLTLEALARLNWKMKMENVDKTVVMFFITKNPYHSINPNVLQSRAQLEEIHRNCEDIQEAFAEKLFNEMVSRDDLSEMPNFNDLVDDYLSLRLRRNIRSWRGPNMPAIVTHDLVDENNDPIMNFLKTAHLLNYKEDKVKVVYHPDFITTANPLFRMEYYQFVRGCNLGIFPSYYEPWGYTPLECCASGLPSITTDLSGFGSYLLKHVEDHDDKGLWVINRKNRPSNEVAEDLANKMLEFVKLERRDRISLRNRVEVNSTMFGWRQLRKYYDDAYARVLSF